MPRRERGFTVVELLIVVAILLIIAAIAIPNYMSAVQRGYEAAAISFLRNLHTAQEVYRVNHNEYAGDFAKLAPYLSVGFTVPQPYEDASDSLLVAMAFAAPLQGQGGTPPGQGGTPPGQGGTPPGQGGTPPGQGGTPPGQGGTPPGQGGTPPGQGGTPPGQGGTPPGQEGTPPGQAGTPPGEGGGQQGGGTPPPGDARLHSLYIFRLTRPTPFRWECTAEPVRDRTRNRFYYTDNSGMIRYAVGALADAASPPIS